MSYRLDDLARRLATRELVTRRRALGVMGGTAAGFALAAGAPRRAYADDGCTGDPDNPVECGDPFGNGACCPTGYTCCVGANGFNTCLPPDGSVCCGDAAATICAPGWSCLADGSNGLGGCCETSNGSTVCGGIYCCLPSEFCVDGACSDCPADQICGSDCCAPGVSCIDGACCNSLVVCAGKCCVSGGKCIDGQCCDNEQVCGSVCCSGDQACLDGRCCPSAQICGSTCCAPNQPCCEMPDGSAACCPDGNSCVREILPGNIGITADSPNICCPPERLVTATATPICCPPGSVHQPGGGVSTNGGLCCTEANVCGQHCCDSLPSFPMKCVNGGCVFDLAKINQQNAQAANNNNVNVQLTTTGSASGQLTLETPAAGASAFGLVAAAKPQVLGSTKFRLKGGGHHTVKIRLNARGRRLVKHHAKLHAEAVITFTKDGKSVSSTSSLTIVAPHPRHH